MASSDCAILCPKNDDCNKINDHVIQNILSGASRTYFSVDSIETDDVDERNNYPLEFINSLTPSGLPPHELVLKPGTIAILIRNLNSNKGLVNGTRVVVKRFFDYCLEVEVSR